MGIKFHCPNGHKLNVKSFLAGKRGVCPKCGSKFRIPAASGPAADVEEFDEADIAHEAAATGNGSGVVVEAASVRQLVAPSGVSSAANESAGAAVDAATGTVDDPIAEQPTAIWYVRPPTGGQYGPARGDVMRQWLTEGRVSSDSLVWREGWTDWQTAGKLFPQLQATAEAATVTNAAPTTARPTTLSPRSSARSAARYQTRQQDSSKLAIGVLVGLAIVCVLLVGVLVYVVMHLK